MIGITATRKALLTAYAAIPQLSAVPIFLDQAPPQTPYPYCVYSQIDGGEMTGQGYSSAAYVGPTVWQFTIFAAGMSAEKISNAELLLGHLVTAFDALDRLNITEANITALTLGRDTEPQTRFVEIDPKTSERIYQSLVQYENQNQQSLGLT